MHDAITNDQHPTEAERVLLEQIQHVIEELVMLTLIGAVIADNTGVADLYERFATKAGVTDGTMVRAAIVKRKLGCTELVSNENFVNLLNNLAQEVNAARKTT